MSITLHPWMKHPSGPRVYFQGLAGQSAALGSRDPAKVYARVLAGSEFIITLDGTATLEQVLQAQNWCEGEGLRTMEDLLTRTMGDLLTRASAPQWEAPKPSGLKESLESLNWLHLAPAARACGVGFKNGKVKAEVIALVLAAGDDTARRVLETAQRFARGENPQAPAPQKPFSEDEFKEPPAPPVDLSGFVRKPELEQTRSALAAALVKEAQAREALTSEVEALKARRPLEIHYPAQPKPVKLEGLYHYAFPELLDAIDAGEHVMLVGPAGSGKTTHAQLAAEKLSRTLFKSAPVTFTGEILGYKGPHGQYIRTPWRDAFEAGNSILLADEFDSSCADAPLAANPILDKSGFAAFPDGMIKKGERFSAILGTNTDGSGASMQYAGRMRMDSAFRDRFVIIQWGYDPRIEEDMAGPHTGLLRAVRAVREFAGKRGILDVVATPRAIQRGRLWIERNSIPRDRIVEREFKIGALVECWRDVLSLPDVAAFLKGA